MQDYQLGGAHVGRRRNGGSALVDCLAMALSGTNWNDYLIRCSYTQHMKDRCTRRVYEADVYSHKLPELVFTYTEISNS